MTAKIKLNAASGGGSISIQAPSSSSNNRVISLPDIADGTLVTSQSTLDATKLSGNLPAISGANLTGISAGITDADQWRVTANFNISSGQDTITSNWERNDNSFDKIGNGMTESSGIFTFPTTGIWFIKTSFNANGNNIRYFGSLIDATINNNIYSEIAENFDSMASGQDYFSCVTTEAIFDCTNVSTHKIRFRWYSGANGVMEGSSVRQRTGVTFIRLGDT